jgi:lipoprotein signal peptidase
MRVFWVLLFVDLASKQWATQQNLVHLNTGWSFSLAADWTYAVVISGVVMVMLAWFGRSWWRAYPRLAGLFWAGVVANMIDRVFFGGVRDWLPIPGLGLYNNLADWYITAALLALVSYEVRELYERHASHHL